jgi:hypothetical protein
MPLLALEIDPYHFACDGSLGPIPHFWNVVTNLPFLYVGLRGLQVLRRRGLLGHPAFFNWAGLWVSTALLCLTSGAYHWCLTPFGLAIDRVAICGIIAFLGAHVAHVGLGLGPHRGLSLAFVLACQATVLAWALGASAWWYGGLQIAGATCLLWVAVVAQRAGRLAVSPRPLYAFAACYALAKVFEAADVPVCELTGVIGGHPLKHLASAVGLAILARMMVAEAERAQSLDRS